MDVTGEKNKDGSANASPAAARPPEWEPKREWWLPGKDFLVVVKHHLRKHDAEDGANLWNVYAYIYPKHWHFPAFSGDQMWQDAATALPLHSGPSFCRIHRDETGITAYQVGCDYNHSWDERYLRENPDDHFPNGRVFWDAKTLFNWLSAPALALDKDEDAMIAARAGG